METEKNEAVETVQQSNTSQSTNKVDFKRMLELLTNPLDSLKLTDKDFIYGIIGLASSYAAYLLWALLVTNRLNNLFNPFNSIASLFNGGRRSSVFFELFGKMLATGLWSIIVLLGVVWLVGWWRGGSKLELKLYLTRIGGLHYIGCAGFLLACIVSASFMLSVMVLVITLLFLLVLTLYAGAELFGVPREKLSLYFLVSVAGYVLLIGILPQALF